jgi:uncharacterized alkaline shock family protein YloU
LIEPDLSDRLKAVFTGPSHPGIRIQAQPDGVKVHLNINVRYGMKIQDVARQVQEIVKQDIKKILEINVTDIDIDIRGLEKGRV